MPPLILIVVSRQDRPRAILSATQMLPLIKGGTLLHIAPPAFVGYASR